MCLSVETNDSDLSIRLRKLKHCLNVETKDDNLCTRLRKLTVSASKLRPTVVIPTFEDVQVL